MNWEDERWVKLYTRDSITWKLWCWQARFVMMSLMRKVDRAGVIDVTGRGVDGLAALLEIPTDIVRDGLVDLLRPDDDGEATVVWNGPQLVIVRFIEAQEAKTSNTQRQRALRERRRDFASRGIASRVNVDAKDDAQDDAVSARTFSIDQAPDRNIDRLEDARVTTSVTTSVTPALPMTAVVVTPRVEEARDRNRAVPWADDAEMTATLEDFASRYSNAYGQRASVPTKAIRKKLRQLLDHHTERVVRERIAFAFETPPDWPSGPYDLAAIVQHFDRFVRVTAKPRTVNPPGVGRFEPSEGIDYSVAPWEVRDAKREVDPLDIVPWDPMPWEEP